MTGTGDALFIGQVPPQEENSFKFFVFFFLVRLFPPWGSQAIISSSDAFSLQFYGERLGHPSQVFCLPPSENYEDDTTAYPASFPDLVVLSLTLPSLSGDKGMIPLYTNSLFPPPPPLIRKSSFFSLV